MIKQKTKSFRINNKNKENINVGIKFLVITVMQLAKNDYIYKTSPIKAQVN